MSNRQKPYIAEPVPLKYLTGGYRKEDGEIWYCHMRGHPDIPVLGSVGTKAEAKEVCRIYNRSHGY